MTDIGQIYATTTLLPLESRGSGTYTSDPITNGLTQVEIWVYASEIDGSASVACSLEWSDDGETGWTAIPGSDAPTLSGPGNGTANAAVEVLHYTRVTSTVTGTGEITYRVMAVASGLGDSLERPISSSTNAPTHTRGNRR
jgi:hypothetical protein